MITPVVSGRREGVRLDQRDGCISAWSSEELLELGEAWEGVMRKDSKSWLKISEVMVNTAS